MRAAVVVSLILFQFSVFAESPNYILSNTSSLFWGKDLQMDANLMPSQNGIWFEGKSSKKSFSVWVSRVSGAKNNLNSIPLTWQKMIHSNLQYPKKHTVDLGCSRLKKETIQCERIERDINVVDGKKRDHFSTVKMFWNGKEDLIILKIFGYEDKNLLKELVKDIEVKFSS